MFIPAILLAWLGSICEREYCTAVSAANTDPSVSCVRPVCACCGALVAGLSQGLSESLGSIYVVLLGLEGIPRGCAVLSLIYVVLLH
jgi:hypothetical protein